MMKSVASCFLILVWASTVLAGDIKGTVKAKGARDARDVVVYLEGMSGKFGSPEKHVRMDQKDLTFVPHVLPVVAGTTVDFMNSDDVLHNVFTPDKCAEKFNLGTWPKGEARSYTFNNVGCTSILLCNVHPEMEAWVIALPNPYFAKTGKDGKFSIENIPPGTYTLYAWHKKLKTKPQQVTIEAEKTLAVEIMMHR